MKTIFALTAMLLSSQTYAHGDLEAHFKHDERFTYTTVRVVPSTGHIMFYGPKWKGSEIGIYGIRHESEVAAAIEDVGECLCEVLGKRSGFTPPASEVLPTATAFDVYTLRRSGSACDEGKKTVTQAMTSKAFTIPVLICAGN